jgi:hypothetical protein
MRGLGYHFITVTTKEGARDASYLEKEPEAQEHDL